MFTAARAPMVIKARTKTNVSRLFVFKEHLLDDVQFCSGQSAGQFTTGAGGSLRFKKAGLLLLDLSRGAFEFHAVLLDKTLHFVEELLGPRAAAAVGGSCPLENRVA